MLCISIIKQGDVFMIIDCKKGRYIVDTNFRDAFRLDVFEEKYIEDIKDLLVELEEPQYARVDDPTLFISKDFLKSSLSYANIS